MATKQPPAAPLEPMLSLDDLAATLRTSRRTVERMIAAGKLPAPAMSVGRMKRWKPETVRQWIDGQAGNN